MDTQASESPHTLHVRFARRVGMEAGPASEPANLRVCRLTHTKQPRNPRNVSDRNLVFLDGLRGLAALYVMVGHARWVLREGYSEGFLKHLLECTGVGIPKAARLWNEKMAMAELTFNIRIGWLNLDSRGEPKQSDL